MRTHPTILIPLPANQTLIPYKFVIIELIEKPACFSLKLVSE